MSNNAVLKPSQASLKDRLKYGGFTYTLRPDQERVVRGLARALKDELSPVLAAMTGFGKTLTAGACFTLSKMRAVDQGEKFFGLMISDRRPLRRQNARGLAKAGLNANAFTSKTPIEVWEQSDVISVTRQTLDNEEMLERLRTTKIDIVIVDECHKVGARSYTRVLEAIIEGSPNVRIIGLSATPARADGEPMWPFNAVVLGPNLKTLIVEGSLVPVRVFEPQMDGADDVRAGLQSLYDQRASIDMERAQQVLDTTLYNSGIVEQWAMKAQDRVTVAFCTTISHAEHLAASFRAAGYRFAAYHSKLSQDERDEIIDKLSTGELQGVTNPLSLTEGFDFPPLSCVMLCRPLMHIGTCTQAIGRGMRILRPGEYEAFAPKEDCIVLDFAGAIRRHGRIECPPAIEGAVYDTSNGNTSVDTYIQCRSCDAYFGTHLSECPECGAAKPIAPGAEADEFTAAPDLVEIKGLLEAQGFGMFRWYSLTPSTDQGLPRTIGANAQDAAAIIVREPGMQNVWRAYVKSKENGASWPKRAPCRLHRGSLQDCMERAGDYLDAHGCHRTGAIGGSGAGWQSKPANSRIRAALSRQRMRLPPKAILTAEAASILFQAAMWKRDLEQDLGAQVYILARSVHVFDPSNSMEGLAA